MARAKEPKEYFVRIVFEGVMAPHGDISPCYSCTDAATIADNAMKLLGRGMRRTRGAVSVYKNEHVYQNGGMPLAHRYR